MTELLLEHVRRVVQRPHHRRVVRHVEHVDPVEVAGRVHHPVDGLVVAHLVGRQAEGGAHRVGDHALGIGGPVAQPRDAAAQPGVEGRREPVAAGARPGERRLRQRRLRQGLQADLLEEHRIDGLHQVDHRADDHLRFVGRVAGVQHPVQTVQDQPRHGVDHRGERPERDHVAGGLDRLLLGLALDLLVPLGRVGGPQVAQILEDRPGVVLEQRRQLGVVVPRRQHRPLVDLARLAVERRHEGPRFLQLHVALAALLRVVERVGVQHAPHELPRDVLEPELEVGVLEDRVVAALEGQRADRVALLVGDLVGADHPRRVAGAGGGDGPVVGHGGSGAQGDAGRVGGQGGGHG